MLRRKFNNSSCLKPGGWAVLALLLACCVLAAPGYGAPLFGRPEVPASAGCAVDSASRPPARDAVKSATAPPAREAVKPAVKPFATSAAKPPSAQPARHAAARKQRKARLAHHYRTLRVCATAYALRGYTSRGTYTAPGTIAVDPRIIPFGSRIYVPGYGWGTALDTGGAIRGSVIDLWMPSNAACFRWGVRSVRIQVEEPPHRPWLASRGGRQRRRHRRR